MAVEDQAMTGGDAAPTQHPNPLLTRPFVAALIESQPLPAFVYSADGVGIYCNRAAEHLMTEGAGGAPRVYAQDGTDLWTIIQARSDEANPFFDTKIRLRTHDGQAPETALAILPFRGAQGSLSGAMVILLSIPTQRLRDTRHVGEQSEDFTTIISRLGSAVDAARIVVLEIDPDFASDATPLASWSDDPNRAPMPTIPLRGTALDSLAGRRFICVPSDVGRAFPDDPMIARGEFQSFVGVALAGSSGEQIGLLAGLWREPLTDAPGTTAAFLIVARQVAHVLADMLAERELRESEQRYGSVFEGSAVPILLVEPRTTQIVDANPAACSLYGYPRDEFMTMSILQVDALTAETVQAELQRALDGTRSNFIGRHLLSGGRVRDVEVSIGPITVGGRQLLYAMVHDITERKRMEAELERSRRNLELMVGQRTEDLLRANAELQQASTARDMIFVNLAQELRTSLQTITGFSDLLLGGTPGDLNREQRRQIEMIQQAGRRLAAFATTLIETHRVEAADLICEPESFDLVDLVESVLFGLASFAEDKGLSLALVADERPIDVDTDRYKLQQILLNLLSNAIRYTERGSVTVAVAREGDAGATVAVADTGPGMPPERLATLFDGPEVHDSSAGIGLPASRRIASLLGGTIEVESALARGSVFTLRLPVECPTSGPRPEA